MKNKKILLLYKKSTFKHLFQDSKGLRRDLHDQQGMIDRFLSTHLHHYEVLAEIEKFLKTSQIEYRKILRGGRVDFPRFDMIITVGGDGTFLEAASKAQDQLILGINSDPKWSVGRFCHGNPGNFSVLIKKALAGQAKVKFLNRMRVHFKRKKCDVLSLNDILICHSNPAAMSRYLIDFHGHREEQRSSGVWVSTAAGSTGATRSAGGKVLKDTSLMLQFVVRELYSPRAVAHHHSQGIIKPNEKMKIMSLMREGVVYVDGSHIRVPFSFAEEIVVHNSHQFIRMICG